MAFADRSPHPLLPVGLVLVLLAGCGRSPEPTAAPPSATAPPSGTGSPVADWSAVDLEPSAVSGVATGIAIVGDRAVVVGNVVRPDEATPGVPVAWTTEDGSTWSTENLPGPSFAVDSVVAWSDRALAVGGGETAGCAHPFATMTWVRDAEGAWAQAPFVPLLCAGGSATPAASGRTAIIVGSGTGDVPYAWSSDDGLHWADHPKSFGERLPSFAVVLPRGGFVAGGSGPDAPWLARTTDGTEWQLLAGVLPGNVSLLGAVSDAAATRLFVADPAGTVAMLTSRDGAAWDATASEGLDAPRVTRIAAIGRSLLATGAGDSGSLAWVSADGSTWRPLEIPDGALIAGGIVLGDRALLVGSVEASVGSRPVAWVGSASLLAP